MLPSFSYSFVFRRKEVRGQVLVSNKEKDCHKNVCYSENLKEVNLKRTV